MTLYLVRHGPTHARTMTGWTDLPADLSDTATLARLSSLLPTVPVVSSDLIRASATADALAGNRPRLPHDPGFREIHFGAWEGRSFDAVSAEDPDLIRAFWESPGPVRAPQGECWDDLCARVWAAADKYEDHADLIIVAHFGAILALVQRALSVNAAQVFAHRIDNLSLTRIARGPQGWSVDAINQIP